MHLQLNFKYALAHQHSFLKPHNLRHTAFHCHGTHLKNVRHRIPHVKEADGQQSSRQNYLNNLDIFLAIHFILVKKKFQYFSFKN